MDEHITHKALQERLVQLEAGKAQAVAQLTAIEGAIIELRFLMEPKKPEPKENRKERRAKEAKEKQNARKD